MSRYVLYIGIILLCLAISFFIFYPKISNQILKVEKPILIGQKPLLITERPLLITEKPIVIIEQTANPLDGWNETIIKYLKFPLNHHYGSHAIVLLATLFVSTKGPVLELGMGSTSTPLLRRLTLEQKRLLVSADSDRRWINYFSNLAINNTLHKLKHVDVKTEMGVEWALSGLADSEKWNIVFIDHRPGPRRQFELMLYADRSDIVILHDTEKHSLYKYDTGLAIYPYKYRFTKLKTYTDVLSLKNETIINKIRYLLESVPDYYFSNITF